MAERPNIDRLGEEPAPDAELTVLVTGEVIDPHDTESVMRTLLHLREWQKQQFQPFLRALESAILVHRMDVDARYTYRSGGLIAESSGSSFTYEYDAAKLRRRLRAAGLPKQEVDDAVRPVKTFKIDGNRIRMLSQHPTYGPIVEECRTKNPRPRYVSVKRDQVRAEEETR